MTNKKSTPVPSKTLEKIRLEEEKARNLIAGAKEKESAQILREARDIAKEIIKDRAAAARKLADEQQRNRILEARREADEILREAEKQVTGMRAGAESKKAEAVRGIMKKIRELIQPSQQ